ncbi:ATP-binding protein [Bacillus mycoides]|nr:ATP-binding protein [Bacillus mycoides]
MNKSYFQWEKTFGDDVLAIAILDRLLLSCDYV